MTRVPTSTMIEMVTGHRSAMGIMFARSVAQWSSASVDAHHCMGTQQAGVKVRVRRAAGASVRGRPW